jgi:hypothetical protein
LNARTKRCPGVKGRDTREKQKEQLPSDAVQNKGKKKEMALERHLRNVRQYPPSRARSRDFCKGRKRETWKASQIYHAISSSSISSSSKDSIASLMNGAACQEKGN